MPSTRSPLEGITDPRHRELIETCLRQEVGSVQVGDPAPDFCLPRLVEDQRSTPVQFSGLTGSRPIALVFGSYT